MIHEHVTNTCCVDLIDKFPTLVRVLFFLKFWEREKSYGGRTSNNIYHIGSIKIP